MSDKFDPPKQDAPNVPISEEEGGPVTSGDEGGFLVSQLASSVSTSDAGEPFSVTPDPRGFLATEAYIKDHAALYAATGIPIPTTGVTEVDLDNVNHGGPYIAYVGSETVEHLSWEMAQLHAQEREVKHLGRNFRPQQITWHPDLILAYTRKYYPEGPPPPAYGSPLHHPVVPPVKLENHGTMLAVGEKWMGACGFSLRSVAVAQIHDHESSREWSVNFFDPKSPDEEVSGDYYVDVKRRLMKYVYGVVHRVLRLVIWLPNQGKFHDLKKKFIWQVYVRDVQPFDFTEVDSKAKSHDKEPEKRPLKVVADQPVHPEEPQ